MAADDYLLSILAVFKDAASGDLKKFGTAVLGAGKATDRAGKKASGFGDKLTVLSAKFVSLRTAASQAQELFRQGFEFAELGAQSIQTTASFDGLLDSLDAAPGTLDELRAASRNTISDLDMMSSTMTLLAGAQGELATALAGSTPKLMEIAKAANALNPALGDTNFLYQSLATGIKRASPMILDNLGLMIKVGDANEKYALSLGKTVDQLTIEEQKVALLNETLRAGNVLIDQAGDNIDSATDDFAGFEAALKNAKIALAEFAVPVLAPLLKQFADVLSITGKEYDAIEKAKNAAREAATDQLHYARLIRESLIKQMVLEGQTRKEAEKRISVTQDGQLAILGLAGRSARAWQQAMAWIPGTYDYWQEKIEGTAAATIELDWATTELGAAEEKQREELIELVKGYGDGIDVMAAFGYEVTEQASAVREAEREAAGLLQTTRKSGDMFAYAEDKLWRLGNAEEYAEVKTRQLRREQERLNKELSELDVVTREFVASGFDDFIYSLVEKSFEAVGLAGEPAVKLQWALAEGLGQIDRQTLQVWNSQKRINELYGDQVIAVDEAVDLYKELSKLAAEPPQDFAAEGREGFYQWKDIDREEVLPGMQELFDEITEMREEALPEEIKSEFVIENLGPTLEAFTTMEGITRYLSGRHNVYFDIQARGEWPTGGGNGGTPPPNSPWSRQLGGSIDETGWYYLHQNELVIPPMEAQQMQQGGGTTIAETNNEFNLNVTSVQEMTSLMQEFELMRALAE